MMSNIPVFATVDAPPTGKITVPLSTMQETDIQGHYPQWQWWNETVQANLTAGQLYTVAADVQVPNASGQLTGNQPDSLYVAAPSGAWVGYGSTSQGATTDPVSGQRTNDSQTIFRAPTSGLYTFGVWHAPTGATNDSYTLKIRPIGLDNSTLAPTQNAKDAQKLAFAGGSLYAFLDPTNSVLTLDGPTGRGFQIDGQFQETLAPVAGTSFTTATITATGSAVTLQSGLGPINIPLLPGTSLTVTTRANGYGGQFGEVATAALDFPGESIITDFLDPLGQLAGLDLSGLNLDSLGLGVGTPGLQVGLALGSDPAVSGGNAPVDGAVPYLYLSLNTGFSASLGKVDVNALAKGAKIVVDPADPSAFIDIQGVPVVSEVGFAISQHGYIPFTPAQTPNHWQGQSLFGDVFYRGSLSIADLTAGEVPISVSGDIVLNFNTTGGSWTGAIAQKVENFFNGQVSPNDLLTDAFGVNGTVSLSLDAYGAAGLDVPINSATAIFSGPARSLFFRGGTVNPLEGTSVAFLTQNLGFTADGYLNLNGQFDATLYGSFGIDGYNLSGTLDVSNTGIAASGHFSLLGGSLNASAQGSIYWNGQYYLQGTLNVGAAFDTNLPTIADFQGSISGSLNVALFDDGNIQVWGNASVSGSASVAGASLGSINQGAYFNVKSKYGLSIYSFLGQATSVIDPLISNLYNVWVQVQQGAQETWQQVVNGWNWFWGGSWT